MQKKKLVLGLVIAIVILMIASVAVSFINKPIPEESQASSYPEYYTQIMNKGKPVFIFFYANWCSHCVNFMPEYEKLEKAYQEKYNFVKINIDNPENQSLIQDFYVTGIPMVYILDTTKNKRQLVDNYILHDTK